MTSEALDEKNSTNLEHISMFGLNRINRAYRSDRKLVAAGLENPRQGISILHWKGPNTGQSCIVTLLDYGRAIQAALQDLIRNDHMSFKQFRTDCGVEKLVYPAKDRRH